MRGPEPYPSRVGTQALLFCYDTLGEPGVQLDTFGRLLDGDEDALPGYTVRYAEFADLRDREDASPSRHPVARPTGNRLDKVVGRVVRVTDDELDASDEYEAPRFRRCRVTLASGRDAWVYVAADRSSG